MTQGGASPLLGLACSHVPHFPAGHIATTEPGQTPFNILNCNHGISPIMYTGDPLVDITHAVTLSFNGRADEGISMAHGILYYLSAIHEANPSDKAGRIRLASAMVEMSEAHYGLGAQQPSFRVQAFNESIRCCDLAMSILPEDGPMELVLRCFRNKSRAYLELGHLQAALHFGEAALNQSMKLWGPSHAETAVYLGWLGKVMTKVDGMADRAVRCYNQAISITRQVIHTINAELGSLPKGEFRYISLKPWTELAYFLNDVAWCLAIMGRFQEADLASAESQFLRDSGMCQGPQPLYSMAPFQHHHQMAPVHDQQYNKVGPKPMSREDTNTTTTNLKQPVSPTDIQHPLASGDSNNLTTTTITTTTTTNSSSAKLKWSNYKADQDPQLIFGSFHLPLPEVETDAESEDLPQQKAKVQSAPEEDGMIVFGSFDPVKIEVTEQVSPKMVSVPPEEAMGFEECKGGEEPASGAVQRNNPNITEEDLSGLPKDGDHVASEVKADTDATNIVQDTKTASKRHRRNKKGKGSRRS